MAFPSVGECLFFFVFYWQQEKSLTTCPVGHSKHISHSHSQAKSLIYSKRG